MNGSPPAINAPRAVLVLLGIAFAVHLVRAFLSEPADLEVIRLFAFIPSRYALGGPAGLDWGTGGPAAAMWSFFTYMGLHGNIPHLLLNSLWMLAFGSAVAWRIGAGPFVLFTLCCGAAGALLHLALHWGEPFPVIGASAAISGHMAGAIRFVFRAAGPFGTLGRPGTMHRLVPLATVGETFRERRSLAFLAVWLVINIAFGLGSGIDGGGVAWEAHIGGFAFGLFLFGLFDRPASSLRGA
jgi:membrane associated rhomboid family serine protease